MITSDLVCRGKSVQLDPTFLPAMVSNEEVLEDLISKNISSIHYMVVNNWNGGKTTEIRTELIRLLRNNGIAVWLMIPACCFFNPAVINGRDDWLMEFEDEGAVPPGRRFYSLHHPEFVAWQKEKLVRIFETYPNLFSGIEFMESYFPAYRGTHEKGGSGFYGDVSAFSLQTFSEKYLHESGVKSLQEIVAQPYLYEKWVSFRAGAVTDFLWQMKKTIREYDRDILFAVWTMGMLGSADPIGEVREYLGLDLENIVDKVRPDLIIIQTAEEDWGKEYLNPDYGEGYLPVLEMIKKLDPDMPVGIQADFVSKHCADPYAIRLDLAWLERFMAESLLEGFDCVTAYDYAMAKKQGNWPRNRMHFASEIPLFSYASASFSSAQSERSFEPQTFVVTNTDEGGWMRVVTESEYKWINPYPVHFIADPLPLYEYPSFSSNKLCDVAAGKSIPVLRRNGRWIKTALPGVNGWLYSGDIFTAAITTGAFPVPDRTYASGRHPQAAQTFTVVDQRRDGWLKVRTASAYTWIRPYPTFDLRDPVPLYERPDFSSHKILPRVVPQQVPLLDEEKGFIRTQIDGWYGYLFRGEPRYLSGDLIPYSYPSLNADPHSTTFEPQDFHVTDRRGDWAQIRSGRGYRWLK